MSRSQEHTVDIYTRVVMFLYKRDIKRSEIPLKMLGGWKGESLALVALGAGLHPFQNRVAQ